MNEDHLRVPKSDLRTVYDVLSDATDAAASGNPNECAAKTARAKRLVSRIHEEADDA